MDPDPSPIIKLINSLRKRGFVKEANILEELFTVEPPHARTALVTDCPICGGQRGNKCELCKGTGELVSIVADDEEDQRIVEELKLKE